MSSRYGLPDPLVVAELPHRWPSREGEAVVRRIVRVRSALEAGQNPGHELVRARFDVYQSAAVAFGNSWWMARVADIEEWTAADAIRSRDLEGAWHAWRAGWWVRRLLEDERGSDLWAHSDQVMTRLRELTSRTV